MPTPSTCSTTAMEPDNPPSTASSAPPTSCSPDRNSWSPDTAGADAVSPVARAEVIITEVDPTKALEAVMDGFRVMSMPDAARIGDVFCTVTGNKNVLAKEHFEVMKNGAIVSNSGHFNVEIDIPSLEKMASSKRTTRTFVEEYTMKDGRKINLLGEGRLINLASAEGHPPSVMDMSFAD